MRPEDTGMGLKSSVGVYLLELARLRLQSKCGTNFRLELFWRMEEMTKMNGKGVWLLEIEKVLKRFDASLEWFIERVKIREEEIEKIRRDNQLEERMKSEKLKVTKKQEHR